MIAARPGRLRHPLAFAVVLIWAGGATAQVLDIGDDGTVTRYDGPTQFLSTGARPLSPDSPAATRLMRSTLSWTPSEATLAALRTASARYGVDARLAEAVAWRESGFNPSAVSPKGAMGVMQLMPGTARTLGVDASDSAANIEGGVDYLARMLRRFKGDVTKALAAYNAGPEAVERYRGVPPYAETVAYVDSILRRMNRTEPPPSPGATN